MGKQVFKCVVVVVLIVGVVGCASYPPPVILTDKATNFEYQYSVDIPQGWEASDKIPKEFDRTIPLASKKMVTLVMINKDSKGLIILANERERTSYKKFLDTPLHKFKEIPQVFKVEAEKWGGLSRYDSHVYVRNLFATNRNYVANPRSYKSEPLFEMEADFSTAINDSTIGMDWFAHPCHQNYSCYTFVMMITNKDRFDNNRPALESVIDSLTMHDIPAE